MNKLILILLLVGVGVYLYIVLFKNSNNYLSTQYYQSKNDHPNEEFINDEFIEQQPKQSNSNRHVHFSEKNTEHIIPNKEEIKQDSMYNDIFIVDPIEIKNTNLTLSENEYFIN